MPSLAANTESNSSRRASEWYRRCDRWNPGRDEQHQSFCADFFGYTRAIEPTGMAQPFRVVANCSGVYCASLMKMSAPAANSRKL